MRERESERPTRSLVVPGFGVAGLGQACIGAAKFKACVAYEAYRDCSVLHIACVSQTHTLRRAQSLDQRRRLI